MNCADIAWQRFFQQGLLTTNFDIPAEAVAWNGALQSQDYAGAKWAVAQRTRGFVSDAAMDQAYNEGTILRTHVLRPTWHFVTPADIRWLLKLTAPRVHAANAYYYRMSELDYTVFGQSAEVMVNALEGGNYLTRAELATAMQAASIVASDLRLTYLVMHAELEGILCSGPRRGKQFTYALLEERVPPAPPLAHDEALATLTKRYFVSHGPALLKDFVWWSGLTVSEAKEGIELTKGDLRHEIIDGQSYWSATTPPLAKANTPTCHLLPNYDEALASFKDYRAATAPEYEKMWVNEDTVFAHYLVIDGWVVGTWKRTLEKRKVIIETKPFRPLSTAESEALTVAAHRFGEFLGLPIELK